MVDNFSVEQEFKKIINNMANNENFYLRQFGVAMISAQNSGFKPIIKGRFCSLYKGSMVGERGLTEYIIKQSNIDGRIELTFIDAGRPQNFSGLKLNDGAYKLTYSSEFEDTMKVINFGFNDVKDCIVIRHVTDEDKCLEPKN